MQRKHHALKESLMLQGMCAIEATLILPGLTYMSWLVVYIA